MRPLLVLILVLAAAAGFFFVVNQNDSGDSGTAITGLGPDQDRPTDVVTNDLESTGDGERAGVRTPEVSPTPLENSPVTTPPASLRVGGVRGTVVDEAGKAVTDAKVILTKYGGNSLVFIDQSAGREQDLETKTDPKGTYAFPQAEQYAEYAIIVTHPDFSRAERAPVIVVEGEEAREAPIVLGRGISLRGRVTDTGGNFVAGAKLKLTMNTLAAAFEDGADSVTTTTGEQGNYAFPHVAAGNYNLTVEADGYGKLSKNNMAIAGEEDVVEDLVLEVAHMVGGTVRSVGGEVIKDVVVQAYSLDNRRTPTRTETRTDDAGEFLISDVPSGTYQIIARHPLYAHHGSVRAESGDLSVTIDLQPLPRVRGTVVSAGSGEPVTNYTVQLRTPIPNSQTTMAVQNTRMSFTDAEGRFELPAPKAGEYIVEGMAKGFADSFSMPFEVTMGADVPGVVVRMSVGGTVKGRVVDSSGAAVSGARVHSRDKEWSNDPFWASLGDMAPGVATEIEVTTDAEGRYELPNLTPTTYQLVVEHRNYAETTLREVVVAEAQVTNAADIILPAGATIEGTVFGPDGRPLVGAIVKMTAESIDGGGWASSHTGRTDESGSYQIRNVRGGSYRAHAERPRGSANNPFQANVDMKITQRTITVKAGEERRGEDFKMRDR